MSHSLTKVGHSLATISYSLATVSHSLGPVDYSLTRPKSGYSRPLTVQACFILLSCMNESWFDVVLHWLMYSSDLWFIICYLYRCIVYSLLSVQEQTKNFALKNDLKTGGIASKSLSEVKWFYTSRRYKAMVLCSHTVLHGQFSKSRNYYPSITVIFTTIRLSPLLSSHGQPWRSPNSLFVLSSACIKWHIVHYSC